MCLNGLIACHVGAPNGPVNSALILSAASCHLRRLLTQRLIPIEHARDQVVGGGRLCTCCRCSSACLKSDFEVAAFSVSSVFCHPAASRAISGRADAIQPATRLRACRNPDPIKQRRRVVLWSPGRQFNAFKKPGLEKQAPLGFRSLYVCATAGDSAKYSPCP